MSTPAGDRSDFIELMSWDESKKAFNFYRRPRAPSWDWKGDTNAAFERYRREGTPSIGATRRSQLRSPNSSDPPSIPRRSPS